MLADALFTFSSSRKSEKNSDRKMECNKKSTCSSVTNATSILNDDQQNVSPKSLYNRDYSSLVDGTEVCRNDEIREDCEIAEGKIGDNEEEMEEVQKIEGTRKPLYRVELIQHRDWVTAILPQPSPPPSPPPPLLPLLLPPLL
ncbi:unnamed protein product [Acanthocheilonema viteae]|uniref:Uncharacterized protein n=1 Tax=Acanthocheilonema viteae TaxID=6277 RepID=A0A498SNS9_ACAVI|nr:unnamed protein product [Acanthocheilonema viteae]